MWSRNHHRLVLLTLPLLSAWIVFATSSCGFPTTFNKILGGNLADIDEFPWLARLEYFDLNNESAGFACAGALIDGQVVLTAAHCITYMKSKNLFLRSVRLGEYNTTTERDCVENLGLLDCAELHQDIFIRNYTVHPQFYNGFSDIALLFLERKVNFTEFVRPICLPERHTEVKTGEKFLISGWGLTEHGTNSTVKLKTAIPVHNFLHCYWKYVAENIFLSRQRHLCAGGIVGKDSCTGDSGTPLMGFTDDQWIIIGITSIGKGCGLQEWPGIYTKVSFYNQWIKDESRQFYQHVNNSS